MKYQEMLRTHSYKYQSRPRDIPRDKTGLGLAEVHSPIPNALNYLSNFNETPSIKPIRRDEQLIRDGIGLTNKPEAFPHTGFLGEAIGNV